MSTEWFEIGDLTLHFRLQHSSKRSTKPKSECSYQSTEKGRFYTVQSGPRDNAISYLKRFFVQLVLLTVALIDRNTGWNPCFYWTELFFIEKRKSKYLTTWNFRRSESHHTCRFQTFFWVLEFCWYSENRDWKELNAKIDWANSCFSNVLQHPCSGGGVVCKSTLTKSVPKRSRQARALKWFSGRCEGDEGIGALSKNWRDSSVELLHRRKLKQEEKWASQSKVGNCEEIRFVVRRAEQTKKSISKDQCATPKEHRPLADCTGKPRKQ